MSTATTTATHVVNWLMAQAKMRLKTPPRRSFVWPPDEADDGFILTGDDGSEWEVLVRPREVER